MNRSIYVLGSINYDLMISTNRMPQQGETIAGYDYFEAIGGKGGNQAASSARLGAPTYLIGSVGRDYHGQQSLDALQAMGVDTHHVEISDNEHTGTAFIIKSSHDNRIIINQGANANVSTQRINESITGEAGDLFLTQFEVPLYAVYEGLKTSKSRDMITVVNPAPAVVMDSKFYPLIDYLVVNQSESEILTGVMPYTMEDCQEAFKVLSDNGVKNCVFTLGSDGSIFMSKDKAFKTEAYSVDVVDTTGAGDTFIGAMMFGLSKGWELEKVMQYASGAGACACTKHGAQEGIPTFLELESFIKEKENE
ncbi:ribokinase [Erysipelothrix inopinata]|uniref:Ribokinase n=1 Tax=Erysipelothrix inopinata TaxID=225084 RepID=A0A7G9S0A4_9FIRM|nr:ribokinase [Erysipelothrix inopinata]QNN61279.1 ribokinase [Erysipelothrix inopinata]